jgi:hypothetical protein
LIFSRPDSFPRAINKIDKNYQNDFASLLPAIVTPTVKEEKRIIRIWVVGLFRNRTGSQMGNNRFLQIIKLSDVFSFE